MLNESKIHGSSSLNPKSFRKNSESQTDYKDTVSELKLPKHLEKLLLPLSDVPMPPQCPIRTRASVGFRNKRVYKDPLPTWSNKKSNIQNSEFLLENGQSDTQNSNNLAMGHNRDLSVSSNKNQPDINQKLYRSMMKDPKAINNLSQSYLNSNDHFMKLLQRKKDMLASSSSSTIQLPKMKTGMNKNASDNNLTSFLYNSDKSYMHNYSTDGFDDSSRMIPRNYDMPSLSRITHKFATKYDDKIDMLYQMDKGLYECSEYKEDNILSQLSAQKPRDEGEQEMVLGNFARKLEIKDGQAITKRFYQQKGTVFWISSKGMRFPLTIKIGQEKYTSVIYISTTIDNPRKGCCDFVQEKNEFLVYYPEDTYEKVFFTITPIVPFTATQKACFYGKILKLPNLEKNNNYRDSPRRNEQFHINYDEHIIFTKQFMQNMFELGKFNKPSYEDESDIGDDNIDALSPALSPEQIMMREKSKKKMKLKSDQREKNLFVAKFYPFFKEEMRKVKTNTVESKVEKAKIKRCEIYQMRIDKFYELGKKRDKLAAKKRQFIDDVFTESKHLVAVRFWVKFFMVYRKLFELKVDFKNMKINQKRKQDILNSTIYIQRRFRKYKDSCKFQIHKSKKASYYMTMKLAAVYMKPRVHAGSQIILQKFFFYVNQPVIILGHLNRTIFLSKIFFVKQNS